VKKPWCIELNFAMLSLSQRRRIALVALWGSFLLRVGSSVALRFTIANEKVREVEIIVNPHRLHKAGLGDVKTVERIKSEHVRMQHGQAIGSNAE